MSNAASPPLSPPPRPPSRHHRSQALDPAIARAEIVAAALPPLLPAIAQADAGAADVRIDAPWVANLLSTIATAKNARGGRTTIKAAKMTTTQAEHQAAGTLAALLKKIRVRVKTHNPNNEAAQRAYGLGANIDPKQISDLLSIADGVVASYDGDWTQAAVNAGVTQAMIDQVASLAASLTQAAGKQDALKASLAQQTMTRKAAQGALVKLCAFAVTVARDVFGATSAELGTLADPRPFQARGAARKAATKAKAKTTAARVAAKRATSRAKPGARAKSNARRAKSGVVATRIAALVAGSPKAAKGAKGATKKSAAKRTAKAGKKSGAKKSRKK